MCQVGQVRNDATITCYVHLSYARRDRRGFDRLARNFPSVQLSRFEARVQRASTRTSSSIRLFGTEARPGGFAQARASAPPRAVHFDASGLSFVSLPSFQIRVVRRRRARANVVQVAPRRHGHVAVLRRAIRPIWTEKRGRIRFDRGRGWEPGSFRTRISFGSNPRSSPINLRSRNPIRPIRFEGLPARSPTSPPLPSRVSNPSFHPERSFCDASYLRREGCGRHRIAGRDGPRGNEREREGERHTGRGVRAYRRSIVVGPSVSGPQFAPPEQRARIYVLRIVRAKQLVCERDGRWPTGSTR